MNLKLWFVAVLFGLGETWYFGWNLYPQSGAEMVCDVITIFLAIIAFKGK